MSGALGDRAIVCVEEGVLNCYVSCRDRAFPYSSGPTALRVIWSESEGKTKRRRCVYLGWAGRVFNAAACSREVPRDSPVIGVPFHLARAYGLPHGCPVRVSACEISSLSKMTSTPQSVAAYFASGVYTHWLPASEQRRKKRKGEHVNRSGGVRAVEGGYATDVTVECVDPGDYAMVALNSEFVIRSFLDQISVLTLNCSFPIRIHSNVVHLRVTEARFRDGLVVRTTLDPLDPHRCRVVFPQEYDALVHGSELPGSPHSQIAVSPDQKTCWFEARIPHLLVCVSVNARLHVLDAERKVATSQQSALLSDSRNTPGVPASAGAGAGADPVIDAVGSHHAGVFRLRLAPTTDQTYQYGAGSSLTERSQRLHIPLDDRSTGQSPSVFQQLIAGIRTRNREYLDAPRFSAALLHSHTLREAVSRFYARRFAAWTQPKLVRVHPAVFMQMWRSTGLASRQSTGARSTRSAAVYDTPPYLVARLSVLRQECAGQWAGGHREVRGWLRAVCRAVLAHLRLVYRRLYNKQTQRPVEAKGGGEQPSAVDQRTVAYIQRLHRICKLGKASPPSTTAGSSGNRHIDRGNSHNDQGNSHNDQHDDSHEHGSQRERESAVVRCALSYGWDMLDEPTLSRAAYRCQATVLVVADTHTPPNHLQLPETLRQQLSLHVADAVHLRALPRCNGWVLGLPPAHPSAQARVEGSPEQTTTPPHPTPTLHVPMCVVTETEGKPSTPTASRLARQGAADHGCVSVCSELPGAAADAIFPVRCLTRTLSSSSQQRPAGVVLGMEPCALTAAATTTGGPSEASGRDDGTSADPDSDPLVRLCERVSPEQLVSCAARSDHGRHALLTSRQAVPAWNQLDTASVSVEGMLRELCVWVGRVCGKKVRYDVKQNSGAGWRAGGGRAAGAAGGINNTPDAGAQHTGTDTQSTLSCALYSFVPDSGSSQDHRSGVSQPTGAPPSYDGRRALAPTFPPHYTLPTYQGKTRAPVLFGSQLCSHSAPAGTPLCSLQVCVRLYLRWVCQQWAREHGVRLRMWKQSRPCTCNTQGPDRAGPEAAAGSSAQSSAEQQPRQPNHTAHHQCPRHSPLPFAHPPVPLEAGDLLVVPVPFAATGSALQWRWVPYLLHFADCAQLPASSDSHHTTTSTTSTTSATSAAPSAVHKVCLWAHCQPELPSLRLSSAASLLPIYHGTQTPSTDSHLYRLRIPYMPYLFLREVYGAELPPPQPDTDHTPHCPRCQTDRPHQHAVGMQLACLTRRSRVQASTLSAAVYSLKHVVSRELDGDSHPILSRFLDDKYGTVACTGSSGCVDGSGGVDGGGGVDSGGGGGGVSGEAEPSRVATESTRLNAPHTAQPLAWQTVPYLCSSFHDLYTSHAFMRRLQVLCMAATIPQYRSLASRLLRGQPLLGAAGASSSPDPFGSTPPTGGVVAVTGPAASGKRTAVRALLTWAAAHPRMHCTHVWVDCAALARAFPLDQGAFGVCRYLLTALRQVYAQVTAVDGGAPCVVVLAQLDRLYRAPASQSEEKGPKSSSVVFGGAVFQVLLQAYHRLQTTGSLLGSVEHKTATAQAGPDVQGGSGRWRGAHIRRRSPGVLPVMWLATWDSQESDPTQTDFPRTHPLFTHALAPPAPAKKLALKFYLWRRLARAGWVREHTPLARVQVGAPCSWHRVLDSVRDNVSVAQWVRLLRKAVLVCAVRSSSSTPANHISATTTGTAVAAPGSPSSTGSDDADSSAPLEAHTALATDLPAFRVHPQDLLQVFRSQPDIASLLKPLAGAAMDREAAPSEESKASAQGAEQVDRWPGVGGLQHAKHRLKITFLYPALYARVYQQIPFRQPSGVLLFGMPGCGKTLLAQCVAKAFGLAFFSVKGPELLNKYIGASEAAVRKVFERAARQAPSVIFFDEFEAIVPRRGGGNGGQVTDRVVNQFLCQLDGVEERDRVYVLGATSRPDMIDPAVLRPGRLDVWLECPLPSDRDRQDICRRVCAQRGIQVSPEVRWAEWSSRMAQFTGADVDAVIGNAMQIAIQQRVQRFTAGQGADTATAQTGVGATGGTEPAESMALTPDLLSQALEHFQRSLSAQDIARYSRIYRDFGAGKNSPKPGDGSQTVNKSNALQNRTQTHGRPGAGQTPGPRTPSWGSHGTSTTQQRQQGSGPPPSSASQSVEQEPQDDAPRRQWKFPTDFDPNAPQKQAYM